MENLSTRLVMKVIPLLIMTYFGLLAKPSETGEIVAKGVREIGINTIDEKVYVFSPLQYCIIRKKPKHICPVWNDREVTVARKI